MTTSSRPTPTPIILPMVSATLLKLRGHPNVWKLCVGDFTHHADQLRQHSPFQLEQVAIAPRTKPEPEAAAWDAIQRLTVPCHNGWFRATSSAALAVFHAVLPEDADDAGGDMPPPDVPDVAMSMPAVPAVSATTQAVDAEEVDPLLWEHVEPCATHHASKASDIRATLITKLGKPRATELLSKTRATVAKNTQGQNNRVLRANGTLLKLKR
jgi:hypothetical protein